MILLNTSRSTVYKDLASSGFNLVDPVSLVFQKYNDSETVEYTNQIPTEANQRFFKFPLDLSQFSQDGQYILTFKQGTLTTQEMCYIDANDNTVFTEHAVDKAFIQYTPNG